jgi:exonuclease VII large subunit
VPSIQTALANKAAEDYLKKLREEAKIANKLTKEKQKQLALDKAKAAEAKKKLALDQASAVLNKANQIFDNDRMQLAAAMQGKLSEEDKVRVKLKQDILDLETAINEGNVSAAAKLASSVTSGAEQLGKMRGEMVSLSGIPNPFTAWLETLKLMTLELAKQAGLKSPITDFTITSGMSTSQKIATLEAQRQNRLANPEYYSSPSAAQMDLFGGIIGTQQMPSIFGAGGIGQMPVVVNVNNAGSVISGGDLAEEMRAIFLNMDLSGSASSVNRNLGSF